MEPHIFPSVMTKNQHELDLLLNKLKGIAPTLHLDIADGQAVPNTSLHFPFRLPRTFSYNAHLMIKHPQQWIRKHGTKVALCIPQFTEVDPLRYIAFMRKKKKPIAFALSPETSVASVRPYLKYCNYILILTVHPGFYGAKFLRFPLRKIKQIKKTNPSVKIIVDGGMTPQTIRLAQKAGADYFVSGSFVSKSDNPRKAMRELRAVLKG